MALSREQFSQNLTNGTRAVRENTLRQCWNELPEESRYFVFLNCSFDGNPLAEGEYLFPDHSKRQIDARVSRTHEEVVLKLWRNGSVSEWIDITPYEVDGKFTYYELRCCGRFTDKQELLYHTKEGYPPFHVFGPILPRFDFNPERDGKFDLHCYRDKAKRIRRKVMLKWGIGGAAVALTATVLLVILQQALPYDSPDRRWVHNILITMAYPVFFVWENIFRVNGDRGLELIVPILGSVLAYLLVVGFCVGVMLERLIGWLRTAQKELVRMPTKRQI